MPIILFIEGVMRRTWEINLPRKIPTLSNHQIFLVRQNIIQEKIREVRFELADLIAEAREWTLVLQFRACTQPDDLFFEYEKEKQTAMPKRHPEHFGVKLKTPKSECPHCGKSFVYLENHIAHHHPIIPAPHITREPAKYTNGRSPYGIATDLNTNQNVD